MRLQSALSNESRKSLQQLKIKLKEENPTAFDKWEKIIMIDKSLIHNLYINVLLGSWGETGNINIGEMIADMNSAFSPFERNRISEMIDELGYFEVDQFFNSLFSKYKGTLKTRKFRVDPEYFMIKKALYKKYHGKKLDM